MMTHLNFGHLDFQQSLFANKWLMSSTKSMKYSKKLFLKKQCSPFCFIFANPATATTSIEAMLRNIKKILKQAKGG